MRCDGCGGMDRREFLERTVMAMSMASLAACGAALPTGSSSFTSFSVNLAQYPALASVGGVAVVDQSSSGTPVAIVRTADTAFLALSLVCPHQGVTVQVVSSGFYCPGHGATFSPNGTNTGGPTRANLRSYAVTHDAGAGTLQVG